MLFLKQYGERRTGTNYLRSLIAANYRDVVVLMHILGDKHSPPVAFDALWREAQESGDPAWQFVSRATFSAPALTTRADDRRQSVEVRRLAQPLAAAFADGALGFLISIKNPYAWAVSLARFLGWAAKRRPLPESCASDLEEACRLFNARYAAWFALVDENPASSLLVRHEDLLQDPEGTLREIDRLFGLRHPTPYRPVEGVVGAAIWDHLPTPVRLMEFDRQHYGSAEYLGALPPLHRRIVRETIDWELLRRCGYRPLGE